MNDELKAAAKDPENPRYLEARRALANEEARGEGVAFGAPQVQATGTVNNPPPPATGLPISTGTADSGLESAGANVSTSVSRPDRSPKGTTGR